MPEQKKLNLRQKLFEIQKSTKTFAVTEESEKKSSNGKSEYNYTPGWEIVEHIRSKMDELGVMLDSSLVEDNHMMISVAVPLDSPNGIVYFEKREMYVTERRAYTWVDVETGETIGPLIESAAGCNGTDKSIASAHSLCERYFLLKQFHFTTREKTDEPDAHDVTSVPQSLAGTYRNVKERRETGYMPQMPQVQPGYGQQMPAYNQGGYAPQMPQQPQQPIQPVQTQQYQRRRPQAAAPAPQAAVNPLDVYNAAVDELSNFNSGTTSHSAVMQKWMTELKMVGYNTAEETFASNLAENAQAKRENRKPNLK